MDWRKIDKIDAHIHILPDEVIAVNQGVDDPYVLAGGVGEYVRLMNENNMTKVIIMPFNDPFLMSLEFNIVAVHQNFMDFQKRYPNRFLLFADVDVRNSIKDTLTELHRVMSFDAFSGIKIPLSNTDMPLDCPYFDAIYSYAEENTIPIEIHSYPRDNLPENVWVNISAILSDLVSRMGVSEANKVLR